MDRSATDGRHAAPADQRPGRHGAGLVARRHPARLPRATSQAARARRPTAASPSRSPTCRSAPAPRCGARTASRHRLHRRRSTRTDGTGPARRRRASTTRPTAPACSAPSAASCTWSTSASGDCRQLTDGRRTPASPPGRPTARTLAFTRKVGADSDLTFRTAVHLLDVDDPQGRAAGGRLRGRHRRHRLVQPPTARACSSSASPALELGHAHLLRVPLDGGEPVDLAGHLDRNVMPGGPAYPGARPVETADGRLLFAIRDRGCTHLWDEPTAPRPRRRRPRGRPASRSPAAPPSSRSPPPRRTARSSRSTSPPAPRRVLTDHGALDDVELFVREERTFTISDGTEVQAWLVRDPERDRARCRCCSTSTAGRTTRGTPPPTRCTSTTRSWPRRAGRCCWSTRAAATATARRSTTACSGAWGVADAPRLPGADRRAGRRGPRRPGPAGGHRLQLRRVHDLLADRRTTTGSRPPSRAASSATWSACTAPATTARLMGRYELGGTPWDDAGGVRRDVADHPGRPRSPRRPWCCTAQDDLTCPVGQAQQWHTVAARARASRPSWCSTRAPRTCSSCSARPRSGSTTTAGWSTGSSSTPSAAAGRASTPPTGSAAWRTLAARARRARRPARHPALSTERATTRSSSRRTACSTSARRQPRHRRLALPDRLDHQGLDGDGRHAAGRRGPARPGRPGRRGAARAAARRPRRHQAA